MIGPWFQYLDASLAVLLEDHVRYFRGPMLLDRYYSLGDGNPLGLDDATEGVLARYRIAGAPGISWLIGPLPWLLVRLKLPLRPILSART